MFKNSIIHKSNFEQSKRARITRKGIDKMNKKIYYHYCSIETFYNILQTGTIRFGNPLNMNDSAEIIWLLKMVKDFVSKKGGYDSILKDWDLIENILKTLLEEMDYPYIFCLSKDKDVLSQWRSYANDGKGVAIGFDVEFIEKHYSLYGTDIIYNQEKQYDILSAKLNDSVLTKLNNAVKNGNREEIYRKSVILVSYILRDAIKCKNSAFQEEKEYRLYCGYRGEVEKCISDIKFKTNDCSIIPFRELCFKGIEHELIKEIVVGPKSTINNRNLWLFLKSKEFHWNASDLKWNMDDKIWRKHVIASNATYR